MLYHEKKNYIQDNSRITYIFSFSLLIILIDAV